MLRSHLVKGSGRGGQFGEIFRPKHFAELTTPSAPLRWLRDFLITGAATPPFQGGEKSPLRSSILGVFFVATTNKCRDYSETHSRVKISFL